MQGYCSRYVKIGKLYLLACIPVLCLACGSRNTETETAAPDRGNLPAAMEQNDKPVAEREEDAEQADTIILFLGNSLSAGAGVDPASAFPALLQHRMDSLGWNVQAINAGLSGRDKRGRSAAHRLVSATVSGERPCAGVRRQ